MLQRIFLFTFIYYAFNQLLTMKHSTSPHPARWWNDFVGLFYPSYCLSCMDRAPQSKHVPICVFCENQLSYTHFHNQPDNLLEQRFWGRIPIQRGTALLYFNKSGVVQRLMHLLKYGDEPKVGVLLGEWFGTQLLQSPFAHIHAIVPVPLHPRKQQQRGYNQAERIATGIGYTLGKPVLTDALLRTMHTTTQTQKSRLERFENVKSAFVHNPKRPIDGLHLLLVDDVMTTGATLEACALPLLDRSGVQVSIATLCLAQH